MLDILLLTVLTEPVIRTLHELLVLVLRLRVMMGVVSKGRVVLHLLLTTRVLRLTTQLLLLLLLGLVVEVRVRIVRGVTVGGVGCRHRGTKQLGLL